MSTEVSPDLLDFSTESSLLCLLHTQANAAYELRVLVTGLPKGPSDASDHL